MISIGAVDPPAHYKAFRESAEKRGIDTDLKAKKLFMDLRGADAMRLVLSRSALDTIDETCSSPTLVSAARRSVRLPHPTLWVEWRVQDQTCGVSLHSKPGSENTAGHGTLIVRMGDGTFSGCSFTFDLRGTDFIRWLKTPEGDPERAIRGLEKLTTGLSALWASPRLIEVEAVETPPRLAAARAKRRAPPLTDYSIVHLSKVATAARTEGATTPGDGARRRGHRVRGHLRLLRSGHVVPVRPHERGDRNRPMSGTVRVVG
ncbi:hypothetical protein [Aureimonas psammosilenae]|uniref:hypothetical protein n=1 Tax=Aureimonas psammosilenae TaxID=2495496 RepID=UPI0012610412|nr:hypothetical protein [Aureimonas psammosilenae]